MKLCRFLLVPCLALASCLGLHAQDAKSAYLGALVANDTFEELVNKIRTKAAAGQNTAAALAPEIAELDENIKTFASDKDAASRFAFLKASIYVEVIGDVAQGKKLLAAVNHDYPDTEYGKNAGKYVEAIDKATKRDALVPELKPLLDGILAKAQAGSRTEEAFKEELAKLDSIAAKHTNHPEVVADILVKKAMIYLQIFGQPAKAREL